MNAYLEKHAFWGKQITKKVPGHLKLIVVIPCYNEPDLITTLQSLGNCTKGSFNTEVIVVLNHSENEIDQIKKNNKTTLAHTLEWLHNQEQGLLSYHIIKAFDLPAKTAGVGLARKIGMDEAVHRFDDIASQDGIIVCLDADCLVDQKLPN